MKYHVIMDGFGSGIRRVDEDGDFETYSESLEDLLRRLAERAVVHAETDVQEAQQIVLRLVGLLNWQSIEVSEPLRDRAAQPISDRVIMQSILDGEDGWALPAGSRMIARSGRTAMEIAPKLADLAARGLIDFVPSGQVRLTKDGRAFTANWHRHPIYAVEGSGLEARIVEPRNSEDRKFANLSRARSWIAEGLVIDAVARLETSPGEAIPYLTQIVELQTGRHWDLLPEYKEAFNRLIA